MAPGGQLQESLDYQFEDPDLLQLALTHRSAGRRNNERLEFLGDAVLNFLIAEAIFGRFPRASEGGMSRMRAALVNGDTLAEIARDLDLGRHLHLGSGERRSGGHRRDSILADALEAVIGAVYLDSDMDRCRRCVLAIFASRLQEITAAPPRKDAKTRLQEYLQERGNPLPEYRLLGIDGEGHAQVFRVLCRLQQPELDAAGEGSSRRRAEQQAAGRALEALSGHDR